MATLNINGKIFKGNNVSICNGRVEIDGVDVTPEQKQITISVEGNVDRLEVDTCNKLNIAGACGTVRSGSGDVKCGDVTGGVQTGSGDVQCQDVHGNVTTSSGDVSAGMVSGNVRTSSGDIQHY